MNEFNDTESLKSKIIIYPTDTVYGIGGNAENELLVKKIFEIKCRDNKKPFSVIAPNKEWILQNCFVSRKTIDKYLPGKYTLILKKKNPKFLEFATAGKNTLGVRIPLHPFSDIVENAKIPFITTSANISGEKPPKNLSEISGKVKDSVDIMIDGGNLEGVPSTIVDCTKEEEVFILRKIFG